MKVQQNRRPIEFHQVAAIARMVLARAPTLSDSEWKDHTLEAIAKQGYGEPPAAMFARALSNVEAAIRQTIGPRPVELEPPPREPRSPIHLQADPPWKQPHPGWWIVARMIAHMQGSPSAAPASARSRRAPVYDLAITEPQALQDFWAIVAANGDRLEVLRVFAEIAIVRPAGWNAAAIRNGAGASPHIRLEAADCFGCGTRDRALDWHHVIQIQHGGSNTPRNRVAICAYCHGGVHPWLAPVARPAARGWSSLADILEATRREAPNHHETETA